MKLYILFFLFINFILFVGCGNNNNLRSIEASGTIETINITLSSKTAGEIKKIYFIEGQTVSPNDTLLEINSEIIELQLQQAIASKDIAEAQLEIMKAGSRKEDVKQAEEFFSQTEINFLLVQKDYERNKNLFKNKTITQKQFDEITAKYNLSQSQFNSAKENLSKVKKIFRDEELAQAESNLKKAISAVELLKKNLKDCFITSPIKGVVVKKFFEQDETVSPMASLIKVSDLSVVNLIIYISEIEIGKIKYGQTAEINVDAFPNKLYKGKIVFISPEAEFTPKNIQTKEERTKLVFAVKIEIQNTNYELKAGMPADVKIYF